MAWEQEITLAYYSENARQFADNTRNVDFFDVQQQFLDRITASGHILDFGCGSGRDSHYFLSQGYKVTALDGADELAALAEKYIGQKVIRQFFTDFAEVDAYDGVWACASLLHLPETDLRKVLHNLAMSLHSGGILYASFKYDDFSGMRHGRYFTDMTETHWQDITKDIALWKNLSLWITGDVREGRSAELWLNILCQRMP